MPPDRMTRPEHGAGLSSLTWLLILAAVILPGILSYALLDGRGDEVPYRWLKSLVDDIARAMVKAFGMSPTLGSTSLERERTMLLETPPHGAAEYSEATAREIDLEVRRILEEQRARVTRLLEGRL